MNQPASASSAGTGLADRPDVVGEPHTAAALGTGNVSMRRLAFDLALAGLAAADPAVATRREVSYDAATDVLTVGGLDYPLAKGGRVLVLGAGKATYPIAVALEEILGDRISGGVVAVRDPGAANLAHVQVIHSDHPLPSSRSVEAAREIMRWAGSAGPDDLVIACFTGGSSALASLPPDGVTPEEKRELHRLLLSSGLAIADINAVRKQVSWLKGGRVAAAAAPAQVVNLTVSDVAGTPLDAVTDPVVPDTTSAAEARDLLRRTGLWDQVAASIRTYLAEDHPPVALPSLQTVVLADGAATTAAMVERARALGLHPVPVEAEVEGPAAEVAHRLCAQALVAAAGSSLPIALLGCGGESTVALGDAGFGDGGPNQECALVAATALAGRPAAAVFLDTDGSDGGTPYAGAIVDGTTAAAAAASGVALEAAVSAHQSTEACVKLGSALWLGHTGTNVNDLFAIVVAREEQA